MALPKLLYSQTLEQPLCELGNVNCTAAARPRGKSPDDRFDGVFEVVEDSESRVVLGRVAVNGAASLEDYGTGSETGTFGRDCPDGRLKFFCKNDPTRTKYEEAAIYVQEGRDNDLFRAHPQGRWSKLAYKVLHHPAFYISDLVVSVLLMMLAILETPSVIKLDDGRPLIITHAVLEMVLLLLLVVDIALRLVWFTPKNFIKHRRTLLITFVLVVMFVEAITVVVRQKNHFRITRALRPLFFIDSFLVDGVRRVLRQVFNALKPIVNVLFLLLFITAFFALMGYYIFATVSFTFFSTYYQSFVSLFITLTTANNPDVMMESFFHNPASPIFFIIYLIISIYFVSNILLAVVIAEFSDENKKKFKKLFLHKREALHKAYLVLTDTDLSFQDFFLFMKVYKPRTPEWHVICLFKAMQANPGPTEWSLTEEEFYELYEVLTYQWAKKGNRLWYETLPSKVQSPFFYLTRMVSSPWFDSISVIIVMLYNSFLVIYTLTIPASSANARYEELRKVLPVTYITIVFYCSEIALTILGKGPQHYFRSFWNVFDFTLVILSLLFLGLETNPTYSFFLAVRPVALIRVLILKRRYHNILNTLSLISARLLSVGLLLVVIFYFFAIIGMEAFGDERHGTVFQGCCRNAWYEVGTFYEGPRLVPLNGTESEDMYMSNNVFPNSSSRYIGTTNVYYLNNFDNILSSYVTLFILMVVNNWYIIMEGFASAVEISWLARLYFMVFYIITLVVIQVVVSYIVEAFVLRIKYIDKKRHCPFHNKCHRCALTEKEGHSHQVTVELKKEDLLKLKYVMVYDGESVPQNWSVENVIRHVRRIDLDPLMEDASTKIHGKRRRTKDDIHLLLYRDDLPRWIEDHDKILRGQKTDNKSKSKPMTATRILKKVLKYIKYIIE